MLSCLTEVASAEETMEAATVHSIQEPIRLDGNLSEGAWKKATPVDTFLRYLPTEGGAPSGNTKVYFLQDETNLYIGVRVDGTDYQPQGRISPREKINDDDQIGIYIDTVGDARTGYIFYLNAIGVQQDIRYSNGAWFMEWNTIFYSEGQLKENGYEIEMQIPFRSLRYPKTDSPNWKVMVTRKNPAEGAKYAWPKLQRRHPRMFMQAKPLVGVQPSEQGAGLFLQPTFSGLYQLENQEGDMVSSGSEEVRPSFDFRWGITSDSGITGTINPDFSQIEGDVRQINLNQRFAFFYPERRPFFLDNIDIFNDLPDSLYTRSIVDPVYGVKLAGREGDVDFGVLHALDRSPYASVHEQGAPGFSAEDLEGQWALNNFLHVRKDAFGQGFVGLSIGDKRAIPTGRYIQLNCAADGGCVDDSERPDSFSDVGALEVSVPFYDIWTLNSSSSFSWVGTSEEQLMGNRTSISLSRSPAEGFGGRLSLSQTTNGYRQELGFINRSGVRRARGSLRYGKALPNRSFSTIGTSASYLEEEAGNRFADAGGRIDVRLRGIHSFGLKGGGNFVRFSGVENLGYYLEGSWESRLSAKVRFETEIEYTMEIDYSRLVPARSLRPYFTCTLRPNQSLQFDTQISHNSFTPEGEETEYATNSYNRLTWQFTKALGTRLVHQVSIFSDAEHLRHNGSLLLTWLKTPGTEAYVGTIWTLEEGEMQDLTFFAKYTHLFRL
ncbi:MAG: sugar-binding protein [Myxococcota bacterium]|nr:sugar-binding protein [Myxococcota bacterium]